MKRRSAHFKVDPRLAQLLGETYRSIEDAVKELVDNSYDADAESVTISIPNEIESDPKITIEDDGSGMKENEVRSEYLNIASSRLSRKGDKTIIKKRKVKGRKGIGKFAGLMVADIMIVETCAFGTKTTIQILKEKLAEAKYDLEKVNIPIETEECSTEISGTRITLLGLNQNLDYPNPDKMKQILMRDYGRETDFNIKINNEEIGVLDLPGASYSRKILSANGDHATLNFTITEKPLKDSGISIRVNNKIIGRPLNLFEEDELIPRKLQKRVYGELLCDDLEEDVTADFGAVIESSKLLKSVTTKSKNILKNSLNDVFKTDMKLAKARYQRRINRELEKLPENKRKFAKIYLLKALEKFYGESEDKINTVISVMIDALEKDYYWDVISNIRDTRERDIEKFADALSEFGILEMSIITSQTLNRLRFLDELYLLIDNPKTLERNVHKALERNLWVIGDEYSLIFSDKTLKNATEKIIKMKFKGENELNRPDLLLGRKLDSNLLLIEFKRPSFTLTRDTERQALEYRDDLNTIYHNKDIEIILLGGKVKQNIISHNEREDVKYLTYIDIVGLARQKLDWLVEELRKE